jgi:uncharacterized protein with PQ loop repeat
MTIAVLAGSTSTVIFAFSTMPMLIKAFRTKDLGSYSLGNIVLSNIGNMIHSDYVISLPCGPIWLLHSFYLVTTAMMLVWYLRYERSGDLLKQIRPWLTGMRTLLVGSTPSRSARATAVQIQ